MTGPLPFTHPSRPPRLFEASAEEFAMCGIAAAFTAHVVKTPEPARMIKGDHFVLTLLAAVETPKGSQLIQVSAWDQLADRLENLAVKKGDQLYCEGTLRVNEWTSPDGDPKHGLALSATRADVQGRIGKDHRPGRPGTPQKPRSGAYRQPEMEPFR